MKLCEFLIASGLKMLQIAGNGIILGPCKMTRLQYFRAADYFLLSYLGKEFSFVSFRSLNKECRQLALFFRNPRGRLAYSKYLDFRAYIKITGAFFKRTSRRIGIEFVILFLKHMQFSPKNSRIFLVLF